MVMRWIIEECPTVADSEISKRGTAPEKEAHPLYIRHCRRLFLPCLHRHQPLKIYLRGNQEDFFQYGTMSELVTLPIIIVISVSKPIQYEF
jgi:hypothetical protein